MQNLHIIRHIDFSFFKCILDVSCNDGLVTLKQDTHLFLREPHGVVLEADFEADGLVRLIDDDFVLGF